jgi:hypothetical protein
MCNCSEHNFPSNQRKAVPSYGEVKNNTAHTALTNWTVPITVCDTPLAISDVQSQASLISKAGLPRRTCNSPARSHSGSSLPPGKSHGVVLMMAWPPPLLFLYSTNACQKQPLKVL